MMQQNSLHNPRCSHTCQTSDPLPEPWEVQYSHEHDQLYYWNRVTGQYVWERINI